MSLLSQKITATKLNDTVLGAFACAPSSEKLDHLLRYLSTWNGSDKLFMIVHYALKLVVPFSRFRASMQHKAGLRQDSNSRTAAAWTKLSDIIGDSRMLWRIWGLLTIYQWMTSIERPTGRPPTRKLLTIERLQGWSMVGYYPLEHLYYLAANSIIPTTIPLPFGKSLKLDINKLGIWSTRFWAAYVFLQFAHLQEDLKLLKARRKAYSKGKASSQLGAAEEVQEKAQLQKQHDAWWNELIVNLGYLPLTIHWSLEKGLFQNDAWVGLFGLIAGIASFRSGWQATALPTTVSSSAQAPGDIPLGDAILTPIRD